MPAGHTAPIRARERHAGAASFGAACAACPLAAQCTTAKTGRTITVSAHEAALQAGRARQTDPAWRADYRATRPKVERKIAHLIPPRHGGRRARVRGLLKTAADFSLLAAAVNLARLGILGIARTATGCPPPPA
ncbi:transposase [Saccharopolyspora spinosa]|uniref:transposase n=1 Tax=Saccharopolyspora spinosa TaxID=60894 RepID=UPI000A01FFD5